MRLSHLIATAFAAQLLAGCSLYHQVMGEDEAQEPVKTTDDVVAEAEKSEKEKEKGQKPATQKDEQELKMARLWARVDELEEANMRNKERIRVLEKGITLGLVPEELKGAKKPAPPPPPEVKEALYDDKAPEKPAKKEEPKADPNAMSKEQADAYQAALASAHDLYRSGR
jgi:hypothetical protein